jgi:RNA-directed DNA polymerase
VREESSLSERPGHHRPRRLADWINPTGARKVHPLIDKVYKRKNSEIARERVTDPIFRDMFRYFE